jgi:hypothetical protein
LTTNYVAPGVIPTKFWSDAVSVGTQYGVDPYLLAAIGKHETLYGMLGMGRQGLSMGYGAYDAGAVYTWQDKPGEFINQLTAVAKKIAAQFSGSVSAESLTKFGTLQPGKTLGGMPVGYASDPLWGAKVWNAYQGLNEVAGFQKGIETFKKDPVGTVTEAVTSDAKEIAGGAAYLVIILLILGAALFFGTKMFTLKG